jgi:hypothetical protein
MTALWTLSHGWRCSKKHDGGDGDAHGSLRESRASVPTNLIGAALLALDRKDNQVLQLLAAGGDAHHHIWAAAEGEIALPKTSAGTRFSLRIGVTDKASAVTAPAAFVFVLKLREGDGAEAGLDQRGSGVGIGHILAYCRKLRLLQWPLRLRDGTALDEEKTAQDSSGEGDAAHGCPLLFPDTGAQL